MTRRISAILGKHSGAGQDCTRHFSVPPLQYKNLTSYKKYRPEFELNIHESYGKRPIHSGPPLWVDSFIVFSRSQWSSQRIHSRS